MFLLDGLSLLKEPGVMPEGGVSAAFRRSEKCLEGQLLWEFSPIGVV